MRDCLVFTSRPAVLMLREDSIGFRYGPLSQAIDGLAPSGP